MFVNILKKIRIKSHWFFPQFLLVGGRKFPTNKTTIAILLLTFYADFIRGNIFLLSFILRNLQNRPYNDSNF
jgi:hypothetical protein